MNALQNISVITERDDLAGKMVFLRVDFNVTLNDEGKVIDDYRIQKARPTIDYLRERGARVIIASHMKHKKELVSLRSVSEYFQEEVAHTFVEDYEKIPEMKDGEVVLLENLRFHGEETANDDIFAKELADMADIYVNDAFAVAHREHASVVGIPKHIPGYLGLLMVDEIENLSHAFSPERPFVFVLGGAKFETKLPLIKKFVENADTALIGGALANDLLRAKGYEVGKSLTAEKEFDFSDILEEEHLVIPTDVVVETETGEHVTKNAGEVEPSDFIWDIGPKSLMELERKIGDAQFILWNGPLGNYEIGFKEGTFELAKLIAKSSATTVLGGGDTLTAIEELDLLDRYSFVSTGGGAMLDFLAHEDLPALRALRG